MNILQDSLLFIANNPRTILYMSRIAVLLVAIIGSMTAWGANGDTFTAKSKENVDLLFTITSESAFTCKLDGDSGVGDVAQNYTGALSIPGTVIHPLTGREYTVKSISDDAFTDWNFTSISLPKELTSVNGLAFHQCSKLTAFSVDNNNPQLYDENGVLLSRDGKLVCFPEGKTTANYYVPAGITVIGDYAFANCKNLNNVTFQHEVSRIGSYAFSTCYNLKSINISATYGATIGDYAFYLCESMTKATLGDGFKSIGNNAFSKCGKLGNINIPNSVTDIGEYAFYGCSALTKIVIPDGVNAIKTFTFYGCESMREVTLPKSIRTIGTFAFDGSPVTLIHSYITNPADLTYEDSELTIFPFSRSFGKITVYVPSDLVETYKNTKYWEECDIRGNEGTPVEEAEVGDEFSQKVEMLDGILITLKFRVSKIGATPEVTIISREDDPEGSWLLTIPETVKDKYGLTYKVTAIDDDVFKECKKLKYLSISKNLTNIGSNSFSRCENLNKISVSSENTRYSSSVSSNCIIDKKTNTLILGCKNTKIPANVKAIGDYAFLDCKGLESIVIPDGVTSIGSYAFARCSKLETVTLPESVTSISGAAFIFCNSLRVIYSYVTNPFTLDNSVFESIKSDAYLFIPNGTKEKYLSAGGWPSNNVNDILTVTTNTIDFGNGVDENSKYYKLNYCNYNEEEGCVELQNHSDVRFSTKPGSGEIRITAEGNDKNLTISIPNNGYNEVSLEDGKNSVSICYHAKETGQVIVGCDDTNGSRGFSRSNSEENVVKIYSIEVLTNDDASYDNILFGDAAVKAVCISRWDTDGDGQLSKTEAACVTTLDDAFTDNDDITYFDELKYFTGLTSIGENAFYGCNYLETVTLPNGITSIDEGAFSFCALTSIDIPDGVVSIGREAFCACFLESINIPSSVRTIHENAFAGTNLSSFEWPENVWSIRDRAIDSEHLTSLTIPASVTSIGDIACYSQNLTTVTVMRCSPPIVSTNAFSNRANATLLVPYGSKEAYEAADCWREFRTIQEAIVGDESIIEFDDDIIKKICIDKWDTNGDEKLSKVEAAAVTDLGNSFSNWDNDIDMICHFDQLQYFIGLTSIGDGTFENCWPLKSVTIPRTVKTIGKGAFSFTGLSSIEIPSNVTVIGEGAFNVCFDLTSVTLSEGITEIGSSAFSGCNKLTSIEIPNSVTLIGSSAFYGCGLTSIVIPNSVTLIGASAFGNCNGLTSIVIPNNVNMIEGGAFMDCSGLTSVDIHEGIMSVEGYTFKGCTSLGTISLPQSLVYIGKEAFTDCGALTSVSIRRRTPFTIDESTFSNRANATLLVPYGSKDAYEAAEYWKDFGLIVEAFDTDNSIIEFADIAAKISCINNFDTNGDHKLSFDEAAAVTSLEGAFNSLEINYPDEYNYKYVSTFDELKYFTGLTSIGYDDFRMWGMLESVIIPKNVTSLEQPFSSVVLSSIQVDEENTVYDSRGGCNAVIETASNTLVVGTRNSVIPDGVKAIGDYAFSNLNITSMTVPNSVSYIGSHAFGYSNLQTLVLPDNVTYAGYEVFSSNSPYYRSLPDGLIYIGKVAYKYKGVMPDDTNIIIPSGTTCITDLAFINCKGLKSVTIPATVTYIGGSAFYGCSNMNSVTIKIRKPLHTPTGTFSNATNATLYVPYGCKATYEKISPWKDFKEIVELPASDCYDLNGDGIVDKADLDAISSHILGNTPLNFDENAADLNGDRKVNAADIVVLITILQQLKAL